MPTHIGPNLTGESNVVFAFDTGDTKNSYFGPPTTNLFTEDNFNVYNNIPATISAVLVKTSASYKGAPIWKETITALNSIGVIYMSSGSNAGLGVYHSWDTFYSSSYNGFSIFFKPTTPLWTTPIFTHYSNISGWQSSTNYDDMGDGWYRAWNTWYSGSNSSDGKFWAINLTATTASIPHVVYWAGPFKENQNRNWVSQYTKTSRTSTQSLVSLTGSTQIDLTSMSFDTLGRLQFNGSSSIVCSNNLTMPSSSTWEFVARPTSTTGYRPFFQKSLYNNPTGYITLFFNPTDLQFRINASDVSESVRSIDYSWSGEGIALNTYAHIVFIYDGLSFLIYKNGTLFGTSSAWTYGLGTNPGNTLIGTFWAGSWIGDIPVFKQYNKVLSSQEIWQNYQQYKTRFNL